MLDTGIVTFACAKSCLHVLEYCKFVESEKDSLYLQTTL